MPQGGYEVLLHIGDGRLVEVLEVAEVVHLVRHPVGDDEDRPATGLALGEQRLDLAEELGVVVDVLDVLDMDAGRLLEVRDGVLVDVERPVGNREVTAGLAGELHSFRVRAAAAPDPAAAAGGDGQARA